MFKFSKKYTADNLSMIIPFIILTVIAVFNSFMYIGLIEDGNHHFWEALTVKNIWLGHEGYEKFPYNSRYFPSLLQHLSVGIPVIFGIVNIKILLFISIIIILALSVVKSIKIKYFRLNLFIASC